MLHAKCYMRSVTCDSPGVTATGIGSAACKRLKSDFSSKSHRYSRGTGSSKRRLSIVIEIGHAGQSQTVLQTAARPPSDLSGLTLSWRNHFLNRFYAFRCNYFGSAAIGMRCASFGMRVSSNTPITEVKSPITIQP